MSEKRYFKIEYDEEWYLFDSTTISEQLVKEQAEYGYGVFANSLSPSEVVGLLNEQQSNINKKKELLKLIANACSFNKEHSVKEILRNEIKGIDTVTYESANAWHDYVLLSEFFEECYGEHWDNE